MIALALTFVGSISVSAQSWSAATVGTGKYALYNLGSGQYFTRGNGWGTQASITSSGNQADAMPIVLEAVGDNFKLRTDVNGSGYGVEHLSGGTIYTDQSRGKNSSWTFTQVGDDNGPIYTILSADNHGGGAGKYMAANSGNTIVDPVDAVADDYGKWKLLRLKTDEELRDEALAARTAALAALPSASTSNPVDATPIILDANFDIKLLQGSWTMESSNYNPQGGSSSNPCAESWQAAFTLSQQLTGLPEGTYVLRAQAAITDYTNAYDGANYPVVYANNVTSPFIDMVEADRATSMTQLSGSFSNGMYEVEPLTVIVGEDGKLTVGVRGTRTNTWCIWDNFRLTFYGFDQAALVAAYHSALAQAQDMSDAVMSASAKNALAEAVANYSSVDETSKTAVRTALNALEAAVAAANQSIAEYVKISAEIENYTNVPGAGALMSKYENRQFVSLDDFYAQLRTIILANVGSQDGVDITAVILNPCPTSNLNNWTGNESNAYDPGNNVAEYWNMSGAKFEQTIPQLPEGTYFLTVKAFTRTGYNSTISVSGGAAASVNLVTVGNDVVNNRTQANEWFNAGNGDNVLAFNIVGAPKDVTITLTADNANGDHWTVWRNFTLEYNTLKDLVFNNFGTTTITLADGTVINNGDTKTANANQIKDGILISFPGNDIKNVPIHPSNYQAFGKIENTTDGITYYVRSNGYFDNGYNPNFTIKFGQGLFGWSDNALQEYIGAAATSPKAKSYTVTIDKVVFINHEMDAVDMTKGYEVNVLPMPFLWGSYAVPDTKDMTAEDYILPNGNQYIYEMFVEAYTAKHGVAPVLPEQDVDYYLELQRYRAGWQAGDAYIDPVTMASTYPTTNPYRALTADEEEYVRFFLATYCEGVILEKDANVPYTFNIRTNNDVKQDVDKIERDQVVTAWDVRGNQVTDLLFDQGIETAIVGIEATKENNGAIYNLAGQRVQTARQGIYVVNGKKVVIK